MNNGVKDEDGNELHVGDEVERVGCSSRGLTKGGRYIITALKNSGSLVSFEEISRRVSFEESGDYTFSSSLFKLINKKGTSTMNKTVWRVMVINKKTDAIVVDEIVIDGDSREAINAKLSIKHASTLKAIDFNDLYYLATTLGRYDKKEQK